MEEREGREGDIRWHRRRMLYIISTNLYILPTSLKIEPSTTSVAAKTLEFRLVCPRSRDREATKISMIYIIDREKEIERERRANE